MKIMLLQPPSGSPISDQVFLHEPLALEYLGAGLKMDGHEVCLHDVRLDPDFETVLDEFAPALVGLTGYTNQVPVICAIADRIKALDPGIRVVVGGHHATVRPPDFNRPSIDAIVIGEGVVALREIAAHAGIPSQLGAIPGLALPGAELRFTAPRPYTLLDELPAPDRSLTVRYRRQYFSEWLKPLASIRTSLGCTARCSFCALWEITGGKYLRRSPERVVEELGAIEEKNVFFCDDESMCDVQRMDRLADLIAAVGLRKNYFLYARGDTIAQNPGLFAKWRDIGLVQVFVGMESFSQERLDGMDKRLSLEQQERAAKILEELGVTLYASFMVDPDFAPADFDSLKAYVRRLNVRHASFSILTPLPGTRLFKEREASMFPYQPRLFDFLHTTLPTRLPLREFYARFAGLITGAMPLHRSLRVLAMYDLGRIPGVLRSMSRVVDLIRNHHSDHRDEKWTGALEDEG
ncbi:MAG: cobalamin B12-binding domain-containing protein [Candidatus Riflebacteria bacterium]|nr:cobalamin B12-binding domain-containing protein [Candidatus Riflebacteria bacterium]